MGKGTNAAHHPLVTYVNDVASAMKQAQLAAKGKGAWWHLGATGAARRRAG